MHRTNPFLRVSGTLTWIAGAFLIGAGVANAAVTIAPTTLPQATAGSVYSAAFTASGGKAPYSFSIASGSVPPAGLQLNTAGKLSGTPTAASGSTATTFKVQVKDSSATPQTGTATISIQINPDPLVISTNSLATGVDGTAYSQQLASSGGTGTVTWKVQTGSALVTGLKLSAAGLVSGTPTASTNGPGNFTVIATDSATPTHNQVKSVPYVINPSNNGFKVATTSLPNASQNQNYSTQLVSAGGTGAVTWALASGSNLPPGLGISTAGVISGQPTGIGLWNFTVQAKDSSTTPRTVTAYLGLSVKPPPLVVLLTSLQPGYLGAIYSATLQAGGGTGPYSWTLPAGSAPPPGLKLASSGALSGSPTSVENGYTFKVNLSDSSKPVRTVSATISLPVFAAVAKCTNDGKMTAALKGRYSLELSTRLLGSADQQWTVGAFSADGAGRIAGGIYDTNGPSFAAVDQGTFTGTYSVGSDARGLLTVTIPPGSGSKTGLTLSFCIAVNSLSGGVAGGGHMMQDDETERVSSGDFYAQGPGTLSAATVKGSWAFGLQGGNLTSSGQLTRHASAGYLTFDGAGKVTAGEVDVNNDSFNGPDLTNQYSAQVPFTGTYTLAATGRGTIALNIHGGSTVNLVYYETASNGVKLLSSDPGKPPGGAESRVVNVGKGTQRTASAFSNASLSGTSVFESQGLSIANGQQVGRRVQLGIVTWDGKGHYTGQADVNDAGAVTLAATNTFSGVYSVDAAGRVTLTPTAGGTAPVLYLAGSNRALGIEDSIGVGFYNVDGQTAPAGGFKLSGVNGSYSVGTLFWSFLREKAQCGVFKANGAGSGSATLDSNIEGDVTVGGSGSGSYTASPNGRFLLTTGGSMPSSALYVVSPNHAYIVNIDGNAWEPLTQLIHE